MAPRTFFFGDFCLQPRGLFRRNSLGETVPVAIGSRPLEVLTVLVERAGNLVLRDELMAAVWPGLVVEYSNLAVQIAALRRVLDEAREGGSCIQTVAGRGYRFVAPVTFGELPAPTPHGSTLSGIASFQIPEPARGNSETMGANSPPPRRSRLHAWRWGLGASAAFALAVTIVSAGWSSLGHRRFEVGAEPRLSITVLPFTDLSENRDRKQFAAALTEDLTTNLSRNGDIVVTSSDAGVLYRDRLIDPGQAATSRDVHYLLEGSVQQSGSRVRVNAHLIDTRASTYIWSEREERDGDLFSLQGEIAGRFTVLLKSALVSAVAARPTENLDAWDYVFRGRAVFNEPIARQSYAKQISLFSKALELNPRSVQAKGFLAISLTARVLDNMSETKQADLDRAQNLVDQVLADVPQSRLVRYAKAQLLRSRGLCDKAVVEYETVLASDPLWISAISNLGGCKTYLGQIGDAMTLQRQAIPLFGANPNLALAYFRLGQAYLLTSRTDDAIPWLEKAQTVAPDLALIHAHLASAYAIAHQSERAASELADARRLAPGTYSSIAAVVRSNVMLPKPGPTIRPLLETTYLNGLRIAGVLDD